MKVIAFNGSPRKEWNTATLLQKALEGAESQGAETELIHLYDLDYNGCISCLECKRLNGKSYGKCILNDDLTPFLDNINNYDAIFLGSPNYVGTITGKTKLFIERLIFPYVAYKTDFPATLFDGKLKVGFIYTMSSNESWMNMWNYDKVATDLKLLFEMMFGEAESMIVNDTTLFEDHSKYLTEHIDPEEKAKTRKEEFPKDCDKAFKMGQKFSSKRKI